MTFEPLDHGGSAALVSGHDAAQVLGIEPRGELGRADQVAEQHSQLTAFGLAWTYRHCGRLSGCRDSAALKYSDRVEELAPMSD
jgi:hypothetical protein